MIEFPITLTSGGSVCMPGYVFALALGYTKNLGVYRLHVDATGEWEGLTIRCFWHVPDGKDPSSSLVVDGYVDVPASVTAQPGSGCITFEGSDDTKNITSADLHYRVSANSGTEDGTEPEPDTPAWQQLVDAVHTDATAAEQAKIDAQTAASEAATSAGSADQSAQKAAGSLQELKDGIANGDFKGEKGDPGPAVALDTTLTHEGEAADAKATGDAISAVKARQNILTGTETGNPISVDDAFPAPLCGLTVYGKSTQDGTPTPDAPVPIVSAGDGGSITVTLSDGNGKTQTLTLPTPNGLPGIPVTSGGNYTDPQGQQWVCDEVDLERGVKVQRVNRLKLDALSWRYELTPTSKSDTFISDTPASQDGTIWGFSLCQYAVFDGIAYDIEMKEACRCYVWIKSVTLQFKAGSGVNSVDSFSEWLKARPDASISYCLATPIETPLTPAEIAAYKALTAYGPDTVVQASDGAGVKLDYQRDVNLVVKNLEDAIASMTTT